ncbi:SRPBCC family protein [Cellulomonas sp. PhB150]|uniref:SRPBCC family protein n=1 Tax=Cellulomonas sp. PhB150 TaxID=2485188 RepID=UPI000F47E3D7|nr:SRPBCC family protein [Cellulomonas sp. PhB150]ROS23995.1 hypothetical protein EDF34_3058 [Cellulomonas sp. PhB150]
MASAAGRGGRLLVAAGLGLLAAQGYRVCRSRALAWGATPAERVTGLAGDRGGRAPDLVATRAISVRADADQVWAWLVQLGRSRGGFYSYDWLENLVGLGIHSADRLEPRWSVLEVGDVVDLAEGVVLTVVAVREPTDLVLRAAVPADGPEPPYEFVWSFHVRPGRDTSRLVVRERYWYYSRGARTIVETVQWVSLVMTRGMLRGIRARAERADRAGSEKHGQRPRP